MARVLCAISGIDYKTDHFPLYLTEREQAHPIFSLSSSRLLSYADKWADGESLTRIDNYLLYLALFNVTGLVEFRVPAIQTGNTQSIIAQNMPALFDIVECIQTVGTERIQTTLNLPKFAITPDTRDLTNTHYWLEIWKTNWDDYLTGYRTMTSWEKQSRSEAILERFIKDKNKDISTYAQQLANWAALAGNFDGFADFVILDHNRENIRLADYWKRIIVACARDDAIYAIDDADLNELIEHCEEHIAFDGIFTHTLMTLLREGAARKSSLVDLGDFNIGSNGITFRILDADASIEDANKLAIIDSAPKSEPVASQYPNKLSFLKAKMAWQMKLDHSKIAEDKKEVDSVIKINAASKGAEFQVMRNTKVEDL